MKPSLEDAIALAARLHKGQRDKAGEFYIFHPLRIMLDPSLMAEEERIVAVLHDVVEDGGITLDELRALGYSEVVIEALRLLTRLPGECYGSYIERIRMARSVAKSAVMIRAAIIAVKVKLLDLRHNADLSRIPDPTEKDLGRKAKYEKAVIKLEAAA